jgi:hypothetical protein
LKESTLIITSKIIIDDITIWNDTIISK